MPTIVSSAVLLDNPQADGRRVIIEQFTDDSGNIYRQSYMADPSADVNARLASDAAGLTAQLQAEENNG